MVNCFPLILGRFERQVERLAADIPKLLGLVDGIENRHPAVGGRGDHCRILR